MKACALFLFPHVSCKSMIIPIYKWLLFHWVQSKLAWIMCSEKSSLRFYFQSCLNRETKLNGHFLEEKIKVIHVLLQKSKLRKVRIWAILDFLTLLWKPNTQMKPGYQLQVCSGWLFTCLGSQFLNSQFLKVMFIWATLDCFSLPEPFK